MKWHPVRAVIVCVLLSPLLFACSSAERTPEYRGDRLSPPLEVPPDLDRPVFNERMKIPELPVAGVSASGDDVSEPATSGARSIEKPPVFLEGANNPDIK